jgi:Zinc metalloprotease (elastase)
MKKLIFAVIFMAMAWSGFAQETILRKNSKGILESVEFSADDKRIAIPATAEVFFKDMLKIKSTDEFRKKERKQKQKEFVHEHFEQYYKGVKVEGGGYNFHYKNGVMYFAHGHYVVISNIDIKPSITEQKAMESFAKHKNIPLEDVDDYLSELIIKEIPLKTDTIPMLVYKIYLYADYRHNTEIGFIDAHTGEVVFTEPALIDFSATGTFATRYSGTQQEITHHYQGGYHLVDSTRGAIIHTWNLEGRTDVFSPVGTTSSAVELTDNDNNWTQAEHRSHNNDLGRSYTAYGVGTDVAENLIVKAVFDGYLRNTTSYAQIRTSMVNAARAMTSTNSYLVHQVENAWYATGVGNTQYQYSISGPSQICDQATYTINLPEGATVQWSASNNNLQLVSEQGTNEAVFKKNGNGTSSILCTLTIDSQSVSIPPLNIQVGLPDSPIIVGESELICNNFALYTVHNVSDVTWSVQGPLRIIGPSVGYRCTVEGRSNGVGWVYATTSNNCGAVRGEILVTVTCSTLSLYLYLYLYPNPADDMVTVELLENRETDATVKKLDKQSTSEGYEIQLWNSAQMLRSYRTSDATFQLPVGGLPAGIYFVRVIKDRETYTQKLIKR